MLLRHDDRDSGVEIALRANRQCNERDERDEMEKHACHDPPREEHRSNGAAGRQPGRMPS
jgi:hypothetical protein